jgi:hypothetical protein
LCLPRLLNPPPPLELNSKPVHIIGMQLVTVFTALNPVDADLVCSRLAAAEFHPEINQGLAATGGLVLASKGILVQVPKNEESDAREFLDSSSETPPA